MSLTTRSKQTDVNEQIAYEQQINTARTTTSSLDTKHIHQIYKEMVSNDFFKERDLTSEYIESVKKVTDERMPQLEKLRHKNHYLKETIKHMKNLIDMKNPANASRNNEDVSKTQDNQSVRSGGGNTSYGGSLINGNNLMGALSSLS